MCPQGLTTFISKMRGDRVSDKTLTLNSGFLIKLLPGDIILADSGFAGLTIRNLDCWDKNPDKYVIAGTNVQLLGQISYCLEIVYKTVLYCVTMHLKFLSCFRKRLYYCIPTYVYSY